MRRVAVILGFALHLAGASPPFAQTPPPQSASPAPLTFQAALDLALQNNAGLAAAKRAKAIREAAIISAKQLPNPEFSFEITRDTPHETVGLGLPFELGGKRARRIDLAREEQSLADLEVRGALQSLRGELRRSFYGLLAAEERVRLADEVAAIARRVREAAQARFDEGIAPRLDVLEAELGLARASADLELERSNRIAAAAALNAVLNRPPGQPVAVSGDLSSGPPPLDAARAWELAAAANLEIVSLHREIAIEGRRADLLRAERIPTPILQGGAVLNAPGEFNSGAFAGLSVEIPSSPATGARSPSRLRRRDSSKPSSTPPFARSKALSSERRPSSGPCGGRSPPTLKPSSRPRYPSNPWPRRATSSAGRPS